jgi:hypothetical protein
MLIAKIIEIVLAPQERHIAPAHAERLCRARALSLRAEARLLLGSCLILLPFPARFLNLANNDRIDVMV